MSKRQLLMVVGVWVIIFLFLGFPMRWEKILAIVTGLLIIVIAYRIRPPGRPEKPDSMPYVEHKSQGSGEINRSDSSMHS